MAQTSAQKRAFPIPVPARARTDNRGNQSPLSRSTSHQPHRLSSELQTPSTELRAWGGSDHSIMEWGFLPRSGNPETSSIASHVESISQPSLGLITEQNVAFCMALINETALLYGSEIKGTSFQHKCCLRHTGQNPSQMGP